MARSAVVEYGDILTLNCTTAGGHNNMFQWYKDDIILEGNTDSILIINNVATDDGGLYECVVNNTAGNSSANITIYGMCCYYSIHDMCNYVHNICLVAPRFITVPKSAEKFIGSAVNLSCSADGFPVPDITWLFQGMNFTNETVNITNSTYTESTIVITNLMLIHGGVYSCEIDSSVVVMSSSSDATVVVIGGKIIFTFKHFAKQHVMLHAYMLYITSSEFKVSIIC